MTPSSRIRGVFVLYSLVLPLWPRSPTQTCLILFTTKPCFVCYCVRGGHYCVCGQKLSFIVLIQAWLGHVDRVRITFLSLSMSPSSCRRRDTIRQQLSVPHPPRACYRRMHTYLVHQTEAGDDCSSWEATGLDTTYVLGATPLVGAGIAGNEREEGEFDETGSLEQHVHLDGVAPKDHASQAFFQVSH